MRAKRAGCRLFFFLLAFSLGRIALSADERIHRFHADIEVGSNGVLRVTETIEVTALGKKIKRGIYRDFPVVSLNGLGLRKTHGFSVVRVTKNGEDERYHLAFADDVSQSRQRVYIGQEGHFLAEGRYTYTLTYTTSDWLLHHADRDELYWNVTGNGWEFPIDVASVHIVLPGDYDRDDLEIGAWTGRRGSKSQDWKFISVIGREVSLETTQVLAAKEGLTVGILWPAGAVARPTVAASREALLRDNVPSVVAMAGVLGAVFFYLGAWLAVGRDRKPGPIVPRATPPELSPAAARYLQRMRYDHNCLAAALVSAANKGALRLERENGDFSVHRGTGDKGGVVASLPSEERVLVESLLNGNEWLPLTRTQRSRISKAVKAFKTSLKEQMVGKLFYNHRLWVLPGAMVALGSLGAAFLSGGYIAASFFMVVWLSFWTFGVVMLLRQSFDVWRAARSANEFRTLRFVGAIVSTVFALPFLGGELLGLWLLSANTGVWVAAAFITQPMLAVTFWRLLQAPTSAGRALLDQIDGYEQWLQGALVGLIRQQSSPEKMYSIYDEHLPWGIALNLETRWADELSETLQPVESLPNDTPNLMRQFANRHGTAAFCLGESLSSAIATSSASSSSGGGGGSSGGGGGGGGGGGW